MNKVKRARLEEKMTQEDLAFSADISQAEISRIENGKADSITVKTALKIAKALGRSVEELFSDLIKK